ncbi:GDSL-type esterase/lipase family protein [Fictibacillus sp. b24]|uniref:GDSL-type esterase/lipase family protein n=1 Tax=Fictibacillus sp. b24 TaxID=3055863 RepID=UPI0025A21F9B|nr:GDSL-type esterase/lipase family protein [Fictibacillus sp. b24]MDM5315452.1 GDSL-type esterase/lipase family protein [Fictibacillus sp. b24]
MRKVSKKWLIGGAALAILLFIIFQNFGKTEVASETKTIKIVALGDSLTYGVGDPSKTGYIGIVKRNIQKQTGRNVIVNNFGISGQRSDQLLKQLENGVVLKALKQADHVFVFIGTNDFRHAAGWNFRQLPQQPLLLGKEKLRNNLSKTLTVVRENNSFAPVYVLGLYNPYFGKAYDPTASDSIQSWNEAIIEVSNESTLTKYISTYELYENVEKDMYFSDSLHPNRRGYNKLGNWVYSQWKPLNQE